MIKLNKNQLVELAIMLADDTSFVEIRKVLGLSKSQNIKSLCEYYGKKYIKLYESHINNIKNNKLELIETKMINNSEIKEMIFKGFNGLAEILEKKENINLIESNVEKSNKENNEIVIEKLPVHLPAEIERCKSFDKVTIRVLGELNEEFKNFIKGSSFKSAELYSLAIYELLKKYNGK